MSLYIDVKYLQMISHRFEIFKRKDDYTFNVRCPVCGDSQKNKRKMRGYFYKKENAMMYKCHNCSHGAHFGTMLKDMDSLLYKEYALERYANSSGYSDTRNKKTVKDALPDFKPKFKTPELEDICDRLDTLPIENEGIIYAKSRMIPETMFNRLFFINDIKNITVLNNKYKNSIHTNEPRLVIPFYDKDKKLTGISLRGMRGEALRYIQLKIDEDAPTVFGLDAIDVNSPMIVVEGPLDSLFLNNAIACAGTSFNKIEHLQLPKGNVTIVFDNQPKNKEIVKLMEKYIELGYGICIWPESIEGKDINDMVISGMSSGEIENIIRTNTFINLTAKMKLSAWRKC